MSIDFARCAVLSKIPSISGAVHFELLQYFNMRFDSTLVSFRTLKVRGAGGDAVRQGRMQSPVDAAGPSPRQAAQGSTTGPLTEMFRGSRQLAEPQPSNFTGTFR